MRILVAGLILALSVCPTAAQSPQPEFGGFAKPLGAYLLDGRSECGFSNSYMGETQDTQFGQVCVPQVTVQAVDAFTLSLIIAELTDPTLYRALLMKQMMGDVPVSEAFAVEVEKRSDDVFDLTDGTVLRKTGAGYVGYVGYHEEGILYEESGNWIFCVSGSSFEVEILREAQRSFGRSDISATKKELERMDPCR